MYVQYTTQYILEGVFLEGANLFSFCKEFSWTAKFERGEYVRGKIRAWGAWGAWGGYIELSSRFDNLFDFADG